MTIQKKNNIVFNVFSNDSTIQKFIDFYNTLKPEKEFEDNNEIFEYISKRIVKNKLWKNYSNLNIGKKIDVMYITCSQKYIDDYPSLSGVIIFSDDENEDYIFVNNNTIYSVSRLNCSYFGNSKGYDSYVEIHQ